MLKKPSSQTKSACFRRSLALFLLLAGLTACGGPTATFLNRRGGGGGGNGGNGGNVAPCALPTPVTRSPSTKLGVGSSASSTFMDLHVGSSDLLSGVSIPYGSLRLWDTLTGWAQINTSSGVYDFSMIDGFV